MATAQDADTCGTLLTQDQQANLVRDQEAMLGVTDPMAPDGVAGEGGAATPSPVEAPKEAPAVPASAPPPPPKASPPKASTRRAPSKTADPCDGGE